MLEPMRSPSIVRFLLPVLVSLLGSALQAAGAAPETLPFVSPIFGDHMVLQQGKPNAIWGWTTPGATVRVTIDRHTAEAVAGADGRWQAQVTPPAAGTACEVRIDGPGHVVLHDVLVGDVWLCTGQSNMAIPLAYATGGKEAAAAARHPTIRLFNVQARSGYSPVATPAGEWQVCTPETAGRFSAVAYFFAQKVQAATGLPIGLVEDCLGGTPAECWMSPATLAGIKDFEKPMAEVARLRAAHAPEYGNYIMHWYDDYDGGIQGSGWFDPALDDRAWKTVHLPGAFAELGLADVPAVVWFRREVTLPDPLPAGDAFIKLGVVEKMETTWVNGQWVGASSWVENPRNYRIPARVLKPGRNLVTVRVFKLKSKAGFLSPPEDLRIALTGDAGVPLAGEWKARVSVDARPPHPLPLGYENYPIMPSVLYQGMIQPILPLAVTGAIWYQGEANSGRAHQYRTLLPAMIRDWRAGFGQGDFPFYIAGLPAFEPRKDRPGSDNWAELREAQAITARTVPHTGLAVSVDTGDAGNIHPHEKQPVGERLALLALARHYGQDVKCDSPSYRAMEREGHAVRVHFDHTDGGLVVKGEKLGEFSLAGADRQWHWADARIDGNDVVVSSPDVPEPVAVRYAWQSNPLATLCNGAGLPAIPFRSDDWPGVTDHAPPW